MWYATPRRYRICRFGIETFPATEEVLILRQMGMEEPRPKVDFSIGEPVGDPGPLKISPG